MNDVEICYQTVTQAIPCYSEPGLSPVDSAALAYEPTFIKPPYQLDQRITSGD